MRAPTHPTLHPDLQDMPDSQLHWLQAASAAPGKGLHLALMLLAHAVQRPYPAVLLTRRMLARAGISRDAAYDGLRRLTELGVVNVRRLPGRSPQVVLLVPGTDRALSN